MSGLRISWGGTRAGLYRILTHFVKARGGVTRSRCSAGSWNNEQKPTTHQIYIKASTQKMSPSEDQKKRTPKTPVPTPPWSVRALSWLAGGHPVKVVYKVKEVAKPKTNDPKTDDPKTDDPHPPEGGSDKPAE